MKTWRARRKREQAKLAASVIKLRARVVEQSREIAELKVG